MGLSLYPHGLVLCCPLMSGAAAPAVQSWTDAGVSWPRLQKSHHYLLACNQHGLLRIICSIDLHHQLGPGLAAWLMVKMNLLSGAALGAVS